ncbi:MAG: hypothetical protein RL538_412 [Candidatus Parcubacteria bacterium]|jgi:hypothetical protein
MYNENIVPEETKYENLSCRRWTGDTQSGNADARTWARH